MSAKRIGDIMMPLEMFPYCPYWFTLRQAFAEIEDMEIKRPDGKPVPWLILVFSAQNQLLGMVQRRDILQGMNAQLNLGRTHQPASGVSTAPNDPDLFRLGFSASKVTNDLREQLQRKIIEFITPIEVTVSFHDPALIAMYIMIEHNLSFVPVAKEGRIVGLAYVEDILRESIAEIV